jgi:hypothetical protein
VHSHEIYGLENMDARPALVLVVRLLPAGELIPIVSTVTMAETRKVTVGPTTHVIVLKR